MRMNRSLIKVGFLWLAALLAGACGQDPAPSPTAFPSQPSGRLEIQYPLDQTLFPPDIAAPTFTW